MSVRTRVPGSFADGRKASLVALAVASALAAGAASAQDSAAGQENLGEIVVTAQKRAETAQEVPISIVALTGLISTFLALFITSLISDGIDIDGWGWIWGTLIVWICGMFIWLLPGPWRSHRKEAR